MKSTKLLSLLLVVVMCLTLLASCGGNKGGNQGGTGNNKPSIDIGGVENTPSTDDPGKDDPKDDPIEPDDGGEDVVVPPVVSLDGVFVAPTRPADAVLPTAKLGEYTYNSYSSALGSNWNPHAWETNAESSMLGYITSPFVSIEAKDTEEGLYQWVGEMATGIKDVTADYTNLLAKYHVNLPAGTKAEDVTKGYVYLFELNPDAQWEDGTPIDADSYIYSMQQLLSPEMKNYRANLYISGESAIAGGFDYYYSLDEGFYSGYTTKYASLAEAMESETVYIDVWGFWGAKGYTDAEGNACPQWLPVTDETVYGAAQNDAFTAALLLQYYGAYLEVGGGYESYAGVYTLNDNVGATWDVVGLEKVDKYSFIYVCDTAIDFNYFLTSCTDTWLVHQGLYEAGFSEADGLKVTNYCTSLETTISYGPYKMTNFEDSKQVIYEQNENWYGYEKVGDYLVSYTQFEVDKQYLQQYITTKIVIDVMDDSVAKQKFMKGELMAWAPSATELNDYKFSSRLQIVDETYTMSFFFHTNVENLKKLDESGKNAYSVVLSNETFRKAMSFAINRSEFVTATQAWTPAFSLMNHLYHYDIYNDPASSYRKSEEAMQAIVNLYGVEYGEGKLYETLEEAHDAITGYNGTEAKALFTKACDELVNAGLYVKGADIKIQIGWAKGSLQQDDNDQCDIIEKQLNAALAGTGFGTITLEPLGNINDRYGDTADGLYAIGYGAWGGAAFYPFRNFQTYMDPDQYGVNELGCWDPTTETLTLTVEGKEVTMTWQMWSNCMIGTGEYADASNEVKLYITAQLEEKFLAKFYRIPLAVTTSCSLSSYKVEDYTDEYNIMYGFGGFRIMDYNYNDAEWAAYVAAQGGELSYK